MPGLTEDDTVLHATTNGGRRVYLSPTVCQRASPFGRDCALWLSSPHDSFALDPITNRFEQLDFVASDQPLER